MLPPLDERRSSPRLPLGRITLWTRGEAHIGRGDVSLGGCFWKGNSVPAFSETGAQTAEVSFKVPGVVEEFRLKANVLHRRHTAGLYAVHMQFGTLPEHAREELSAFIEDWFTIADASGLLGL